MGWGVPKGGGQVAGWRLLRSRPRTLQAHGGAQTLGGPPGRTFHGTGGQSGTRPYLYGRTCPASTHLWLRQTPQSRRLRRQPKRTQAGESHTRPPPLAAQGGVGGGHRAAGRAGSVAGVMSRRWRRRSGWRLLPHQGGHTNIVSYSKINDMASWAFGCVQSLPIHGEGTCVVCACSLFH